MNLLTASRALLANDLPESKDFDLVDAFQVVVIDSQDLVNLVFLLNKLCYFEQEITSIFL